jgi:hypothetical protein
MKTKKRELRAKSKEYLPYVSCSLLIAVCFMLCALCLFGCGYTLHSSSSLPFDAVRIGKIENKTVEPKLQDMLYQALTEEFLKHGISVSSTAEHEISGVIDQFDLRLVAEKEDVAAEYEVIMKGNFSVINPAGERQEFVNISSPFLISFSGFGTLNELLALKEKASESAVREIALTIVAAIIYQ